jgi:hypoxanthine phosphoribosyltransferase
VSAATTAASDLQILFSREQIRARVAEMGRQIDGDYAGEKIVLVGVLKGAAIFLADLARSLSLESTFDFVAASSYGKGQNSSGSVKLIKDLDESIAGKNVILVEDILDTGLTLAFLSRLFQQRNPKSLRVAALLDKPSRRLMKMEADYVGFTIPDRFVIGYGMDFAERYRGLPDICLMPSDAPVSRAASRE